VLAALLVVVGLLALGAAPGFRADPPEEHLVSPPGYRTGTALAPGTEAWLATGTVPGAGTRWEPMARLALADIAGMLRPNGTVAAGPGGPWSYFWPRDGSFVAVALARSGHPVESGRLLDRLASLDLAPRGGFQARYHLDGSAPTDRPRQSDGCGWVLWAVAQVRAAAPEAVSSSADDLRDRCVDALGRLTVDGSQLPPPSPDYREVEVDRTSLGTVAPMLVGLRAAADDYRATGEPRRGVAAGWTADRLAAVVAAELGPRFERFGRSGGLDAATTFLLPPFTSPGTDLAREAGSAARRYAREAVQPAGGVAPGVEWVKRGGASWTPQTALLGLVDAAGGRPDEAARRLDWLDGHRTAYGSLPEKVTRTGRPGGPAPLVWTSALVLLTLDELDRAGSLAAAPADHPAGSDGPAAATGARSAGTDGRSAG
jgi:GH15 family glucan-1,4-alpha-glucosidase